MKLRKVLKVVITVNTFRIYDKFQLKPQNKDITLAH